MDYVYDAKCFDTGFEVDNYPWGFRLKTKRRYWIETTKHGDRFCYATLNPKNNQWCKPKKSTYKAVMVMNTEISHNKTYVSYDSIMVGWSNAAEVCKFEHQIDKSKLSKEQQKKICECKAVNATNKLLEGNIEFVNSTGWSKEQKEAHEKKQKEINQKLINITNHNYGQCLIKNNLGG
tara:strand:- start:7349 stop:7882 length:534 start_codon:yes stop_codon:yes gene_type:complete